MSNKNKVLELIEKITHGKYRLRWVDHETTLGDFDGRDFALDVFDIPCAEELEFLRCLRPYRKEIKPCVFIFHTPEATQKHYRHLFDSTKGAQGPTS